MTSPYWIYCHKWDFDFIGNVYVHYPDDFSIYLCNMLVLRIEHSKIIPSWILSEIDVGLIYNHSNLYWRLLIRKSITNMEIRGWIIGFVEAPFYLSQKSNTHNKYTYTHVVRGTWCDNKCTIENHSIAEKIVSKHLVIRKYLSNWISTVQWFYGFHMLRISPSDAPYMVGIDSASHRTQFSTYTLIFWPKNNQTTIQYFKYTLNPNVTHREFYQQIGAHVQKA